MNKKIEYTFWTVLHGRRAYFEIVNDKIVALEGKRAWLNCVFTYDYDAAIELQEKIQSTCKTKVHIEKKVVQRV